MSDIKRVRITRWIVAGIWVGLIYATLYSVRPVTEFLKQYAIFPFLVNAGIVSLLAVLVGMFLKKGYIHRASTYSLLFLIVAIYFFGLKIITIPEERIHFVEYGILAALVYRALILDFKNGGTYFLAFIVTSLLGAGDEGIQHLLPNRYFQFQDIFLNSISAALGLFFVFVIRRDIQKVVKN